MRRANNSNQTRETISMRNLAWHVVYRRALTVALVSSSNPRSTLRPPPNPPTCLLATPLHFPPLASRASPPFAILLHPLLAGTAGLIIERHSLLGFGLQSPIHWWESCRCYTLVRNEWLGVHWRPVKNNPNLTSKSRWIILLSALLIDRRKRNHHILKVTSWLHWR